MKRKYKEGDWIRVPLDAHVDALGVIARACRSRLFGYFFAVPSGHAPAHEELKALRPDDAAACALFGGAPLEESRWSIVATSVPFDREAWPFPQFVSRGAFGRVWTRHTYDPDTLAAIVSHPIDEATANGAPDARFATACELEDLLRERLCDAARREPLAVYEVRAGFDAAGLRIISRGGRVQFSEKLSAAELQTIAQYIASHPEIELRVHGFSTTAFDARALVAFQALRSLILDVKLCDHLEAIGALTHLHRLRIGAQTRALPLDVLPAMRALHELEVSGKNADVSMAGRCSYLESLTLIDTRAVDFAHLKSAPLLRELTIAHVPQPLTGLDRLVRLTRLELRDLTILELPDLSQNRALETLVLRNVRELRDLRALARIAPLRELEITGAAHLNVDDFKPLAGLPQLRRVRVDLGSRRKAREVYRLLHLGTKTS